MCSPQVAQRLIPSGVPSAWIPPISRRVNIDCFEQVRLLEDSGFGFLPDMDQQDQPSMEAVMSVGLRLCALEFISVQLNIGLPCLDGVPPGQLSA